MRLHITHVTRHDYDRPVRAVVQSHRLTPSLFEGQAIIDWSVEVSDGIRGAQFRDGAGDMVSAWSVQGPVDSITVTVRGTVETRDMAGMLRGHRETVPPRAYLRDTPSTRADVALTQLALGISDAGDNLTRAHALSTAVAEAITYSPGTTHAHTTAAEALALGSGVCQDHAHALIACARARGLPARYVSGYLHSDASGEAHQSSHAWAEIHLKGLGWVGFDPANECCPDERYIRLGSGLDAQDAAPIRGVARGTGPIAGRESLEVSVAVQASEQ